MRSAKISDLESKHLEECCEYQSDTRAKFDSPRFVGRHRRYLYPLCLEVAKGEFQPGATLRCQDYPDFYAAIRAYLDSLPQLTIVHAAAVAIANPVDSIWSHDQLSPWQFSIEEMRQARFDTLLP